MTQPTAQHPIIPRERLNFGLDGDIDKYWFGGDPFKSRFWDASATRSPIPSSYKRSRTSTSKRPSTAWCTARTTSACAARASTSTA
jgi:hypothetical protein